MDRGRLRFIIALLIYLVWIASLAVMASLVGRHPTRSPAVVGRRVTFAGSPFCDVPSGGSTLETLAGSYRNDHGLNFEGVGLR